MTKTSIEWTEETWNPVTGCTKVSAGCDHCYAERITNRFGGPGAFDTVVLHPERLEQPLHWRKPRTVFVNSMADLFHDDVPEHFIFWVFDRMRDAPAHTFQVLTKRPGRMASLLERYYEELTPLPNVWLGTSVENQKWADVRIPKLLETPAAVRFLSCEPLLGPVSIWSYVHAMEMPHVEQQEGRLTVTMLDRRDISIDWCIVGGESGPGARPMDLDWARSLRDECIASSVPFFLKQLGGVRDKRGHGAAVLDGQEWKQFPKHIGGDGVNG